MIWSELGVSGGTALIVLCALYFVVKWAVRNGIREACRRMNGEKGWTAVLKNRLKERRAALGVNQQELGRMAGVSRQTISLIERGDYSPSVTLALTLAKICGVTVEDIFILEEENDEKQ